MKTADDFSGKDLKSEKKLWRQLGKIKKSKKYESENTKNFRIVQSVKAGHIRGGHAFH